MSYIQGDLQLGDVGFYRLMTLASHASNSATMIRTQSPHIAPEISATTQTVLASQPAENNNDRLSPYDLLMSRHGSACDMWSVGTILLEYAMGSRLVLEDYDTVYDFVEWCWDYLDDNDDFSDEYDSYDSYNDDDDDEYDSYDDEFNTCDYDEEYNEEQLSNDGLDDEKYDDDDDEFEDEVPEAYHSAWDRLEKLDQEWLRMILQCLSWTPAHRPSIQQLLERLKHLWPQEQEKKLTGVEDDSIMEAARCYMQWKEQNMSHGVNVTEFFATRDCIRTMPSIHRYTRPVILLDTAIDAGIEEIEEHTSLQRRIFFLPANILHEWCIANCETTDEPSHKKRVPKHLFNTVTKEQPQRNLHPYATLHSATGELTGKRRQASQFAQLLTPLDKEIETQKELTIEYRRLLLDYPSTRSDIIRLAQRRGIPGVLRGEVWAAILGVEEDLVAQQLYDSIDTCSTSSCDRQISVDVPRCHQYNLQLSSPEGHAKLTRILKAWVKHHSDENLVYWQGLDSLCAPFLVLNFHFEARAFCCLKGMVQRFVRGFFESDNSMAMQHALALFDKLLLFHDPELALHLHNIGYHPELYAIPWFLTLYAHVLPIEKLLRLWDHLLLANDHRTPLYFGIAFLRQIRSTLLHADFNTSVSLLTSMLTGIDIRTAIEDLEFIAQGTPRSLVNPPHRMLLQQGTDNDRASHDAINDPIPKPRMSIAEYRENCLCGRIDAEDFERHLLNVAIVLDTRPESEYRRCHLAVSDHVGPLESEHENGVLDQDEMPESMERALEKENPELASEQQASWFSTTSNLVLSKLRTPTTPSSSTPTTPSSTPSLNRDRHAQINKNRSLFKHIEERVLSLVTYKSGLPIVIVSSCEQQRQQMQQQQQQQQQEQYQTEMSRVSSEDGSCDNPLIIVERLLLRHHIPYVSVVYGGMEEILTRTRIPIVQEDEE